MTKKAKTATRRPAVTEAQPAGNRRQRVLHMGPTGKLRLVWREREI